MAKLTSNATTDRPDLKYFISKSEQLNSKFFECFKNSKYRCSFLFDIEIFEIIEMALTHNQTNPSRLIKPTQIHDSSSISSRPPLFVITFVTQSTFCVESSLSSQLLNMCTTILGKSYHRNEKYFLQL